MTEWRCRVGLLLVMVFAWMAPAFAQAPAAGSAAEFYMKYRKVFESAKKVEELFPYMSAATRNQVEATPAAERPKMFEFIKMMGAMTNMKVVKEEPSKTGATLTVEALESRDYPILQGIFLVLSVSVVLANLGADMIYGRLDPRVRS